jgi:phospholipid/cholesterol/gamma-HCH transport system ATP-binding protein
MSIQFEQVTKKFGSKTVLDAVSFQTLPGEILFILGKSGVGKSVTLKLIIGLLKPDQGHVFVEKEDVTQMNANLLGEVRRKCGMVFQHPALLDSINVYENVAFGLRPLKDGQKISEKEKHKIVTEKLALVRLGENILYQFPAELSLGMQKRVSIARTLAPAPRLLLFDEPTTSLDPISTGAVGNLVLELSRTLKTTTLVVSHDMEWALKIADRILVLEKGKIVALDTPEKIKESKIPLIVDFLSEVLST